MMDLSRTEALLGEEALARLSAARVAVIGVGGVGSWCAEALVRTGVGRLTLVDDDIVVPSNVNRQCPATAKTLGRPKVEALRERLLDINPEGAVVAVNGRYPSATPDLRLSDFDLVVDAIDSVDCKAELILSVTAAGVPLLSSMGAARRLDPTKVVIRRFEKITGDGLARALRQRFKRLGRFPSTRFDCAVSTESAQPVRALSVGPVPAKPESVPKGSMMPVTCAFGMALAAEAIRKLTQPCVASLPAIFGRLHGS